MKSYEKIILASIAGAFALGVIILAVAVSVGSSGGSTAAKPHLDSKSLEGCYVKTEANAFSNALKCTYYWFRADGRMYFGIPPAGTTDADFNSLEKSDSKNCGTYTISGENLTLKHSDGTSEAHTYSPDGGGIMDASPLQNVWRFKDGATLDGKWGMDVAVPLFGGGGGSASSSKDWIFHSDGSYEDAGHAGVDSKQATGLQTNNANGKYQFADNRLKITYGDGTTKTFNAMGVGDTAKPSILVIDGIGYYGM
jgi:hypothetical protein